MGNGNTEKKREEVNEVKVEILDREFVIKGQAEPEYIFKLSKFVDKKLHNNQDNNLEMPRSKVMILTLINLADQFFKARERIDELESELEMLKKDEESNRRTFNGN